MNLYHLPSQFFIGTIVTIVFIKTWHSAKSHKLSRAFSIVWILFWALMLLVIFNLSILSTLAGSLGIGRGVDLIIYLALIIIFYSLFNSLIKFRKLNRDITLLVRKEALRDVKNTR